MDRAYRDAYEADRLGREARGLRNEEALNRDNPRVVQDLEDAARNLEAEAADLQAQSAEEATAESAPSEDSE